MRRAIALAVVVGLGVGLWVLLGSRKTDELPDKAPPPPSILPTPKTSTVSPRRSLVPTQRMHEDPLRGPSKPEPPPPPPRSLEESALAGLELEGLSESDRERLKVPKAYGSGVRITRVEPDSPAAEIGLRPDDVILRAQRTNVNSVRELETAIGDRDQTLLNVARSGQLMQAVIRKPFVTESVE